MRKSRDSKCFIRVGWSGMAISTKMKKNKYSRYQGKNTGCREVAKGITCGKSIEYICCKQGSVRSGFRLFASSAYSGMAVLTIKQSI
jgi:hypothetical protein